MGTFRIPIALLLFIKLLLEILKLFYLMNPFSHPFHLVLGLNFSPPFNRIVVIFCYLMLDFLLNQLHLSIALDLITILSSLLQTLIFIENRPSFVLFFFKINVLPILNINGITLCTWRFLFFSSLLFRSKVSDFLISSSCFLREALRIFASYLLLWA